MQKIYKNKDGYYAVFTQLSNGSWVASEIWTTIEVALLDKSIDDGIIEEKNILKNGWVPFEHQNLEWLVAGDIIKDKSGNYRRILSRDGVGEKTLYHASAYSKNLESDVFKNYGYSSTAYKLKTNGYTRYVPEQLDPKLAEAKALLKSKGYKVERV